MKRPSVVPAAVTLGAGALALVVALVLAFVPFTSEGTPDPTPAFRAQQSLDEVLFKMATSPAAKYTGKVTYTYEDERGSGTVEFTDLITTASNTAEGTISVDGIDGEYRQINNSPFLSAPVTLWNKILTDNARADLDMGPLDNKWAAARYTSLPWLGGLLGPPNLAGDIGNIELDSEPELGAELPAPNKGLPDARRLPTADPPIEFMGEDKVKIGTWEVTFAPEDKKITHIKGTHKVGLVTYEIDTAVSLQPADQAQKVFANQRALVSDLVSVPLPGLGPRTPTVVARAVGGSCTQALCPFDFIINGTPYASNAGTGHFNYGLTLNFSVGGRPGGALGGDCRPVVRVDFNRTVTHRCSATNLPSTLPNNTRIEGRYTYTYLAFADTTEQALNRMIDDNEKQTNTEAVYVRTGNKSPDQARFGASVTGLPSYYAVKKGDYLFDGIGTDSNMHVTFGPGYDEHIVGGEFDPSWEGTEILKKQMAEQVEAAGDVRVVYFTAEESTATALRLMILQTGNFDKVSAFHHDR